MVWLTSDQGIRDDIVGFGWTSEVGDIFLRFLDAMAWGRYVVRRYCFGAVCCGIFVSSTPTLWQVAV